MDFVYKSKSKADRRGVPLPGLYPPSLFMRLLLASHNGAIKKELKMNGDKVERRGGARLGAGRKHGATGKAMEIVYLRLPREVAAEADRRAEEIGVNRSNYLRNLILSFFEKK